MNRVNEFSVEPGVYKYRGDIIVVCEILTHGETEPLPNPLVVWRPLVAPVEHVAGTPVSIHRRYSMEVQKFKMLINSETIKKI